jgi:hypothetical protein
VEEVEEIEDTVRRLEQKVNIYSLHQRERRLYVGRFGDLLCDEMLCS